MHMDPIADPSIPPEAATGRLVPVETEPGIMTPTPERLYALAKYLETLQR